jgi:methylamine dehydrogenase heavy chain
MRAKLLPSMVVAATLGATTAMAASPPLPVEQPSVATLPDHRNRGWFWIGGNHAPSQVDGRFHLIDASGRHLGQLSNGFWPGALHAATRRDEVYVAETYFARGLRGQRTDVVTAYDGRTLSPLYEVVIPPKRMVALGEFIETLSDDERFLLVMNYTPAQSVSVVDLERRVFVTEIDTPGCAAIYPAGPRDFYMLCGNGGFLHFRLDDSGRPVLRQRIAPVFDPVDDFYTTGASRDGDTWYFLSRRNRVHVIRMTPAGIRHLRQWSLLTAGERKDDEWRISGRQHTSLHRASGRLYVLMHEGPDETRQDPGTEVWVYDVGSGKRMARHELEEMTISMAVTQGPEPRLYTVDYVVPMPYLAMLWVYLTQGRDGILKVMQQAVSVYDAQSGKRLAATDLPHGNLTSITLW